MVYFRITLHVPYFNGSLLIAIKPKDKEKFLMADMLLFYIIKNYLKKLRIFRRSNIIFYIVSRSHCRSHLTGSRVRHVNISDCMQLKITKFQQPLMA
jgi:hypothetical protein